MEQKTIISLQSKSHIIVMFLVCLVSSQRTIPITRIPGDETRTCPLNLEQVVENIQINITSELDDLIPILFGTNVDQCGDGLWRQVAHLNVSDPTQRCPSEWMEYAPIRSCGQPENLRTVPSCVSTFFSGNGRPYSKVCGRAVGYQWASPDAFTRFVPQTTGTADDNYVDGLSVTHGSNPRQHIWTFAAGYYEATSTRVDSERYGCPCALSDGSFGTTPASYVGDNYFCESGNPDGRYEKVFFTDPLWDGQGCVDSECCTFNSPPWFSVTLPNPTTDDIEARICADDPYPNEATAIEVIELYVQ